MKRHHYLTITALVLCVVGFTLLLSFRSDIFTPGKSPYKLEIVLKARSNPPDFWRIVEQGVSSAAEEYDVQCTITGAVTEQDVDGQIALVEEAIARRPHAIILAASDPDRLVPVCQKAVEQGIRLITVDSDVHYDGRAAFVGTDNRTLGRKLAEQVDRIIGTKAAFGVIGHVPASTTAVERLAGLMEQVTNADNRLAGIEYCNSDSALSKQQTIQMLSEHPEIRCMVGLNESSAVGIAQALEELGLNHQVALISCDSSSQQIQSLESGTIQAVVIQNPFNMGYIAVQTAIDLLRGKDVPAVFDTGSVVIPREEMYTPDNQKRLFPFIS